LHWRKISGFTCQSEGEDVVILTEKVPEILQQGRSFPFMPPAVLNATGMEALPRSGREGPQGRMPMRPWNGKIF
jgi:hypothetical protein